MKPKGGILCGEKVGVNPGGRNVFGEAGMLSCCFLPE